MGNSCDISGGGVSANTSFTDMPPPIKHRKIRRHLLCMLFDHKYIDKEIIPGVIEPECKRCGKLRDVHPPKEKLEDEQNTEKLNKTVKK